jgi:hypothetical protein
MRVSRPIVALLMILWLPLQGVAAVAMPFCKHAFAPPASAGATAQTNLHDGTQHAHHGHSGSSSHQHDAADTGAQDREDSGLACNDCGACHLACSPAAPASSAIVGAIDAEGFVQSSPTLPKLFIPEQRNRPPLTAIV